jgi:HK97 family phage prohead protease
MEIKRFNAQPVELLSVQREGGQRKIRGLASLYYDGTPGSEYQLGENLFERIARGAWDNRLTDDVSARVNHDPKLTVGRTPKTLQLWATARGLEYEITLPNTSKASDLWEEVSNDIIRGSSFHALVADDGVEYQRDNEKRIVLIKKFEKLLDVAPVNSPAYVGSDCSAVVRAYESWEMKEATRERMDRMKNLKW